MVKNFPEELPFLRTPDTVSSCKYLGIAGITWRSRVSGIEPEMFPQEGMHVSNQFMPFMGAPPALFVKTLSMGTPTQAGTVIPAKAKTRFWLRSVTVSVNVLNAGVAPTSWNLNAWVDNNTTFAMTVDESVLGRTPAGAYVDCDINGAHDLDLLTSENKPVTVFTINANYSYTLVRYNEVQVL